MSRLSLPDLNVQPEQDLEAEQDAFAVSDGPAAVPFPAAAPLPRRLRAGCYLVRYTPTPPAILALPPHYDGTLRVERSGTRVIASGDLYLHRPRLLPAPLTPKEPNPAAGVPVFPLAGYRYYVRVTKVTETVQLSLSYELHRFDPVSKTWTLEGAFKTRLAATTPPTGFPSPPSYFTGAVTDAGGGTVGTLALGWVSPFLRRATIEFDRVAPAERALTNAAGLGWRAIFEQVGWDLTVDESDANLVEPSGESWTDAEVHSAMLTRRDSADLDGEWRYWLVSVRRLDSTERGIMFDAFGGDSNNIPREGAAMASHWMIPNTPQWGLVRGQRFGTATDPYFRTGVHEIGHAMGLYHNTVDNGFMNTTDVISGNAVAPQQFPQNVKWAHAPDDQQRLRHMPDLWVRPGGVPFGAAYTTAPIASDDAKTVPEGVALDVQPLLSAVPIGAPVRVDLHLSNPGGLPVPADLSMRAGHVTGAVVDPSGTSRAFRSIIQCIEAHALDEREAVGGSLTLLRGVDGALFPLAGPYTIRVDVEWDVDATPMKVSGEAVMMVTPAADDAHALAALRVMTTPDTLLTLAFGGDHLEDGIAAVGAALENDVLRPHFAFVEAKRVAAPFFDREADLGAAAGLLDASAVMSGAEVDKAARLVAAAKRSGSDVSAPLVETLRDKARETNAERAQGTLDGL